MKNQEVCSFFKISVNRGLEYLINIIYSSSVWCFVFGNGYEVYDAISVPLNTKP